MKLESQIRVLEEIKSGLVDHCCTYESRLYPEAERVPPSRDSGEEYSGADSVYLTNALYHRCLELLSTNV